MVFSTEPTVVPFKAGSLRTKKGPRISWIFGLFRISKLKIFERAITRPAAWQGSGRV